MIDTVRLLVPRTEMSFVDGVISWELFSKTANYAKFVRNPSKANKDTSLYFPRLTGYKRKGHKDNSDILIEFSAPKLLYLNNLDELEDKDFDELIMTLRERLRMMGMVILRTSLEKATVSAIHFSKNILLEDGYSVNHIISEMNKVDLIKTFDFSRAKYTNDGQSLYLHTTSHQFTAYDKGADMGKSEKRAIDKDKTTYQMKLFSEVKKAKQEILRFEARLGNKKKIDSMLEGLGYGKGLNFRQIFREEIAKKVLWIYWEGLIKKRHLGLFSIIPSSKDIVRILFANNKKLKPKQAIYLLGLFVLAKDENGIRELRSLVSKRSHSRTWYRFTRDMRLTSEIITKSNLRDWVSQIDRKLDKFEPYKHKKLST